MTTGILLTSAMAMNAQAHAMGQIGTNVANVSTTGYKRQETMFETLLSYDRSTTTNASNSIFTAGTTDRKYVTSSGVLGATSRRDDLAVSGNGYFMFSSSLDGATNENNQLYSRAGDFTTTRVGDTSYLTNSSGNYVLGWNYNNSTNSFSGGLSPLTMDIPTEMAGAETTTLAIRGNIDSNGGTETSEKLSTTVYDSAYGAHVLSLKFDATGSANSWDFSIGVEDGVATSSISAVEFNADGTIKTPTSPITVNVAWDDGTTSSVSVDMSKIEQYSGDTTLYGVENNGAALGQLLDSYWDSDGILQATYTNSKTIPVCKLALANFVNPNMLEAVSGTMFTKTGEAGDMTIMDLEDVNYSTSSISGSTLEGSNVKIEQEFTNMITTQKAYTSASKVFQTGDEMYQEAIAILS